MFVDASAILGILLKEDDHLELTRRLSAATSPTSSVVALFEAFLGAAREVGAEGALDAVERFVEVTGIEILSVDRSLLPDLASAHRRYGRGMRHPAKLNMGDCYSYALAKKGGLTLLYKGDDFARTDLA